MPKCRPEIEGCASIYFFIFGSVFPLGSDRTKPDVGAIAPVPGAPLKKQAKMTKHAEGVDNKTGFNDGVVSFHEDLQT